MAIVRWYVLLMKEHASLNLHIAKCSRRGYRTEPRRASRLANQAKKTAIKQTAAWCRAINKATLETSQVECHCIVFADKTKCLSAALAI
jgi:hypothetical protein